MAANTKNGTGRKRTLARGSVGRTATTGLMGKKNSKNSGTIVTKKTKSHVTSAAGQGLYYRSAAPTIVESHSRIRMLTTTRAASYSQAEEQAVVRLARNAEAARSDPGENLTGLSDQEFLARLLG